MDKGFQPQKNQFIRLNLEIRKKAGALFKKLL